MTNVGLAVEVVSVPAELVAAVGAKARLGRAALVAAVARRLAERAAGRENESDFIMATVG